MEAKMTRNCWRIIKNDDDHAVAMARLIELASADLQSGTDDFDEFELLGLLIEHYENSTYPMDKPDPIEAIKFRMDQQGLSQADMKQFIGSASKVSEVLNRRRPLSLSMIRRIHDGLGIPADILIQDMSAIEWSLVDTVEDEVRFTGSLLQYCTSIFTPDFSNVSIERYVAVAKNDISITKKFDKKQKDIGVGAFRRLTDLAGSFSASVCEQQDESLIDGNFSLVS
ncbi:helix-turn-helix domain-containing protein [Serratia marcescens]|uniref:helix-turn-helix domain-containing protein n=1 Tax=Serratia marcescens TaxID=615 RepID=UPI001F377A79|nr:transcriptional regulator [Serratia marcescens]